ncbi:HsdM family class I SAM-dependent methyltransferase [Liberiplasma polymorphum]|uniref:HsdM family class I SAM-dependent methyltransferase n=1 Tax=Liberiplasma polymorphum TaxID=3374570 RepID=UPI00377597D2
MHDESVYIKKFGRTKIKKYSQFFTPYELASSMTKWVLEKNPKKILDPAVGNGIFLANVSDNIEKFGYEIDSEIIQHFKEKNNINYTLHIKDYLRNDWVDKYDGIVCNPPYNKFQALEDREPVFDSFRKIIDSKITGYTNQYSLFLLKSLYQLNDNGRMAYIVPAEFMNAGYGEIIKRNLLKSKSLKGIILFSHSVKVFSEATTTVCIILIDKSNVNEVSFSVVNSLEELEKCDFNLNLVLENGKHLVLDELDPKDKWLIKFNSEEILEYNTTVFSDYAKAKRGIATGDNDFFVFSKSKLNVHTLSKDSMIPCITKSQDVKGCIFSPNTFKSLKNLDKNVYLFDGTLVKTKYVDEYIKYGEDKGSNLKYLTKKRSPWYKIENRNPAPIWINVFSRDKLKVIRNLTETKNLTTFHGIYLNKEKSSLTNILFLYLLTPIGQEILYRNKREYGNGLDKFEPGDINKAEVLKLDDINVIDRMRLEELYEDIKANESNDFIINKLISKADNVFRNYL